MDFQTNLPSVESLLRQNISLKHRVAILEEQLTNIQRDEGALRDKLEEINLTRAYINDQLTQLGRDYEDRIKQLEAKIDKLSRLNQKLLKQNNSYREEQQLFEARFIEKERLLTLLFSQEQGMLPASYQSTFFNNKDKTNILQAQQKSESLTKNIDEKLSSENVDDNHPINEIGTRQQEFIQSGALSHNYLENSAQGDTWQSGGVTFTQKEKQPILGHKSERRNLTMINQQQQRKFIHIGERENSSKLNIDPSKESINHHAEVKKQTQQIKIQPRQDHTQLQQKLPPPVLPARQIPSLPPKKNTKTPQTIEKGAIQKSLSLFNQPPFKIEATEYTHDDSLNKSEVKISHPPPFSAVVHQHKFPKPKRKIADPKVLEFKDTQSVRGPPLQQPIESIAEKPMQASAPNPKILNAELDEQLQFHTEQHFGTVEELQQVNAQAFFAGIAHSQISEIPHNDDITATNYFMPGTQVPSEFQGHGLAQDSFGTDDDHSRSMSESVNFFQSLAKTPQKSPPRPPEKKQKSRRSKLKVMDPSAFD